MLALVFLASRESFPAPPGVLTLEVKFPDSAVAGELEPILVTGMHGEGDLLTVRYINARTAVFHCDHWGAGGPTSAPATFEAGARHVLRVEMPSLTAFTKPPPGARGWLRLHFDGQPILEQEVLFHARLPKQLFFGENAIGGSANTRFRGSLRTPDGRRLVGGPETYFSLGDRLSVWLRARPWEMAGIAVVSALCGALVGWFADSRQLRFTLKLLERIINLATQAPRDPRTTAASPAAQAAWRRSHAWFAAVGLLASVSYAWLVTGSTFNFNHTEIFGVFYDYQARSLLDGRLDVPEEAIGPEAFEARGKLYGYFGPTPALLRIPFVAAGMAFGKLSRAFMVLYFVACLFAAYLILCDAARRVRLSQGPAAPPAAPSGWAISVLLGSTGLGSTILFLGSRGLIFHEAILAGIAFALWGCWASLRYLHEGGRWWLGALVCGILSLHCRPPTGLFSLTVLGCAALVRMLIAWRRERKIGALRAPIAVGLLAVLGFGSLNGLAWLKFRTFDPAPLRISRPYAQPGRLEHIDGKSFHLVNIPYNIDTYLLRPNFRFEETFPWFYLMSNQPRRDFPKARIDLPDHTLALPYAMPSLFMLATVGCLAAALWRPATATSVAVLWAAALPVTIALLAAVATAQRYTGDFVPFLVSAAAFGPAAAESARGWRRVVLRGGLIALTLVAVAANSAMALYYQGDTLWGVPEETRQNFQRIRRAADAWFSN